MSTYAVGDLQACLSGLQALLARIGFDAHRDRLLLTGDLIGRGPEALGTLRFVRSLGAAVTTVLGNHDLNLLSLAARGDRPKAEDRLDEVLDAPDAAVLLEWLAQQPLAHYVPAHGALLVHAGLAPQWTIENSLRHAHEIEGVLRDARCRGELLGQMYGDEPRRWNDTLVGIERLRCALNILTRARVCTADGEFDYRYKRAPDAAGEGLMAWFAVPGRRSASSTILFGHWSTLGRVHWPEHRIYGLDTGYVWGGRLTALRLDDGQLFDVASPG